MKHQPGFIVLLSLCSLFLWSCNCECDNGESSINLFGSCDCECYGNWDGSHCNICNLECKSGGVPNDSCTACNCPEGFIGPLCDSVIAVNQSMTLFITDNTGTVQCTEVSADLNFSADKFIFSGEYIHPATQHSYLLTFYADQTDIDNGFVAFYSGNNVFFDDYNNADDNFSTTYGQIIVDQYNKDQHFIGGYYYFDGVSGSAEINLGLSGEFLLNY